MTSLIQNLKDFFLIFTTGITIYFFIKNYNIGFKYYMYFVIISASLGFARTIYAEAVIIPILLPLSVFAYYKPFDQRRFSFIGLFVLIYGVFITLISENATFEGIDVYFVYGLVLLIFSNYLFRDTYSTLYTYVLLWFYAIAKSLWLIIYVGKDVFLPADLSANGGRIIEFETELNSASNLVRVDPNYFGFIAGIGCLLSILFIIYRNHICNYITVKFIKTIWFLIVISLIAVLEFWLSTRGLSRGILLALVVSILVFLFLNKNFKAFAVSSALLIIVIFTFQDLFELFLLRFSEDNTGSGRYEMWGSIWNLFLKENKLLFGFGLNYPWWHNWDPSRLYASTHNSWLTFIMNVGLIGFTLLIVVVFKSMRINYKTNTAIGKIRLVMLSYFVVACFSIEPLVSNIGWILFAVSLAYENNSYLGRRKKWIKARNL